MATFPQSRILRACALSTILVLAAGCGSSSVDASDIEDQISSELERQVGAAPESVDCPDDLDAEVGAETRCELSDSGATLGVTVTVKEVDDGEVRFDIAVDEAPEG